jgi:SAM-dependent methyltransferase
MGKYVDLLRSLPKAKRDVAGRRDSRTTEVVRIAREYGREYFDGDRKYGYGGYDYDGRWKPVAYDIAEHYRVRGGKVLDVGCAKGFLVYDLLPWADVYGLDVSGYAVVERPLPSVVGRLHLGTADYLPFPDNSFDLVLSINTLHNLPRPRIIKALREMLRVSRGGMFIQVDSYSTPQELARFRSWVLTAEWTGYPVEWLELFEEAGYDGDYCWTIV